MGADNTPKSDIAALQPYQTLTVRPGPVPAPQSLQTSVYKAGMHEFAVQLTGTGVDGGPYMSRSDSVIVVLESIDDGWWQWVTPNDQVFQWKNDNYSLLGKFTNKCVDLPLKNPTVLNGSILILESGFDNNNQWVVNPYPPATIINNLAQSGDQDVTASIPAKQWRWAMAGTYKITGSLTRSFLYNAHLSNLHDQYGNDYPSRQFWPRVETVSVSDQKQAAAIAAFGAFGTWLTLSEMAAAVAACWPCFLGFSAGATAALTALGIAGKIADDPPPFDPQYRQEVKMKTPSLSPLLENTRRMREIWSFFELIVRMLASVDALNTVANRLAISRQEKTPHAVRLHISTYRRILTQLGRDSKALDDAVGRAVVALNHLHEMDEEPEGLDEKLSKYEMPMEARAALAAISDVPLSVAFLSAPGNPLVDMTTGVRLLAMVMQRDASEVVRSV